MPIRIPSNLPAQNVLSRENIFVMDSERAATQDIRPMEVGILNLMPNKMETEEQFLRLLSNTPLQVNVDLIRIDNQAPKNTPKAHMDAFYREFDEIANKKYDGLIVTGAPLAHLAYQDVKYWEKMTVVMDWARRHVQSTLFSCWAAHAAIYHYFGKNRVLKDEKLSGVYPIEVQNEHDELLRGFDPVFYAPQSRYGEIPIEVYQSIPELSVLASSAKTGAHIVASQDKRLVFVTGHPEYDPESLSQEYHRDLAANLAPKIPVNYFPDDDPSKPPMVKWRAHGSLLFTNWLNYYVYQTTPYDLDSLSR
ncbi:MAG: homoserine O-succinyltransferase [Paraglaciecola sp.]|uniref:homoserine O-acetyltransferase MetA n=1 Tax=Pseudomonadati TaxID=3379134 RepID=UPI00273D8CD1|nr:homoserine O-succinyltransferase [Paraglaciecola sp.]MDP5031874.1 homoserine O-succinyltransferase [Paraglaciecola sp.]MDP5133699.1 homoserine O-succinyltransferase [Paraglaciecola sp.]